MTGPVPAVPVAGASPMVYAEDFAAAWDATAGNRHARDLLLLAMVEAHLAGAAAGGAHCCGTPGEWHRPWCWRDPKRRRDDEEPG